MKKNIAIALALFFVFGFMAINSAKADTLSNRLKGRILLQVESNGEAWYVNPKDGTRYYMADGNAAYDVMRNLGVGITDSNLAKLQNSKTQAKKYAGKIFLQVESHGEAYYINSDGTLYYLKDGSAAYDVMRSLGLGITNANLEKITTSDVAPILIPTPTPISTPTSNTTLICNPNWQCNAWIACVNYKQIRVCSDLNNCGITTGKPNEVQSCNPAIPVVPTPNPTNTTPITPTPATPSCTLTATINSNGSINASWTSENAVSPATLFDNYRGIYDGGVIQWQTIGTFNGSTGSQKSLAPATNFKIVFSDGTTCVTTVSNSNAPTSTTGTTDTTDIPPTLSLQPLEVGYQFSGQTFPANFIQPKPLQTSVTLASFIPQYNSPSSYQYFAVDPTSLVYEVISSDFTKGDLSISIKSEAICTSNSCATLLLNSLPSKGGKFQIKIIDLKFYKANGEKSALGLPLTTVQYEVRDPNVVTLWSNNQQVNSGMVYIGTHTQAILQINWVGVEPNSGWPEFYYMYAPCNGNGGMSSFGCLQSSGYIPIGRSASVTIPLTPDYSYEKIDLGIPLQGTLNASLILQ